MRGRGAHARAEAPVAGRATLRLADVSLGEVIEERIRAIVREELESRVSDEWIDQTSAPIPRKSYLRLVREGKLPGRKVGKQVLVRRKDLEAFIDTHRPEPRGQEQATDGDIDEQLAKLGFVDRR